MRDKEHHLLMRTVLRVWRWLSPDAWQRTVARILVVALVVAAGGFAFITFGLMPIAANEGHWPTTQWLLKYTMTRSVRMQSIGTDVPSLDDPTLAMKGAGHYATDCMPCHGAPGQTRSMVVEKMVPTPPHLTGVVHDWEPQHLHWIVKHGIKYTAMPAWPSQLRDDEVWAMVAFLQRLPGMDATQYRELAYGPLAASPAGAEGARLSTMELPPLATVDNCARCHGADGEGRGDGAVPRLAGQREGYLLASLRAFARGERHSGIMQPVAAGLDPSQMQALARHYASLPSSSSPAANAPVSASITSSNPVDERTRGATLATLGVGNQRIPACRHCHGPGASERNPIYPQLAGQHPRYLASQLRLFQQSRRGGTRYQHLMHRAASALSEQQIKDLAEYYGSLQAEAAVQ